MVKALSHCEKPRNGTRTLVVCDNQNSYKMISNADCEGLFFPRSLVYARSPSIERQNLPEMTVNLKEQWEQITHEFDLVISLHCKQIFPSKIINTMRCINIHPGYNPHTRGWFPHVFAIVYCLPAGVTIHEMSEKIDDGPIIYREEILIDICDTSETLYKKIIILEENLIRTNLNNIIDKNYTTILPESDGRYFSKREYEELKKIDPSKVGSFLGFYNLLRALTHPPFKNAEINFGGGCRANIDLKIFR